MHGKEILKLQNTLKNIFTLFTINPVLQMNYLTKTIEVIG